MPFTLPSRFKLEDTKDRHSLETPLQHSTYPLSATIGNVAGSSSPRYFITPLSRRSIVFGLCGLTLTAGALASWKLLQLPPQSSAISTPKTTSTSIHTSTAISTPQPEATSSPSSANSSAPSSRILYFGSTDNNLYALNPSDKTVLWRFQGGNWMNSRPAVVNNVVYAGSNDANLYALNASNGTSLWRYQTGNQVVSWPAVVNGAVYFGS
jgi:outer membrane protein assembly factor BamB